MAEDSVVNQQITVELLGQRGHRVKVVVNGARAVEAVQADRYDLVLMDIEMPEMDGIEAVKKIRELESVNDRPRVRVIAMTGHAMTGDRERFLFAGMDGHLVKPYPPNELFAAVEDPAWIHRHTESNFSTRIGFAPPPKTKKRHGDLKSKPVLDRESALANAAGDQKLADELLATCLTEAPKMIERAKVAIEKTQFREARRVGHSLQSSFAAVGAMCASAAARRLEFCKSGQTDEYFEAVNAIQKQFEKINEMAGSREV